MKKVCLILPLFFFVLLAKAQDCPQLSVEPNTYLLKAGDTLVFTVLAKYMKEKVTYNWTISAGTIISGQGTRQIRVSTNDAAGMFITATAEINGLPATCTNVVSNTVEVTTGSELIVKVTFVSGAELKKAVRQFIDVTAFTDPSSESTAFIYLYRDKHTTVSAIDLFKQAITKAFEEDKVAPSRFKIVVGGEKKLQTLELYELQKGAKEPPPSTE